MDGVTTMKTDTSPQAQAVLTRIDREMSADQKFRRVFELTRLTRELAMARIAEQHPEWNQRQVRQRLVEELYGVRPPA